MNAKDFKAVLLETILSPSSTAEEKQAATDALAKLDVKPVEKPAEDSGQKMIKQIEAENLRRLIEESKYPEACQALVLAGQGLSRVVKKYLCQSHPNIDASTRDGLYIETLIAAMNDPASVPGSADYVEWIKKARRYLNSVGVNWPVGGLDWITKDDPHCSYRQFESDWYAPEAQGENL